MNEEIDNEKEEFIRRKKEELGIEVNEEDNEKKDFLTIYLKN